MSGRRWRLAALCAAVALAGLGLLGPVFAKPRVLPLVPEAITVSAAPIPAFRPKSDERRFGVLEYLGGVRLSSDFAGFGGISGFVLEDRDRFFAITDAGLMLTGRLDLDGERPLGLSEVRAAALKDDKGRPLRASGRGDIEAVAMTPNLAYVSIEGVNEIWRFPRPPMERNGTRVRVPALAGLPRNRGIESLAYVNQGPLAGALLAVAEDGPTASADLPGFIITSGGKASSFTITRSGAFSATDLAVGPEGALYLLERHFSWLSGVSMQIRRLLLSEVKPGAVLTGTVLGTFDMGFEIDNMEGLAATTGADGGTVLTVISDDNFSPFQRTLLLRFAVRPD